MLAFVIDQLLKACDLEALLFYDRNQISLEVGLTRFFRFWRDQAAAELQALVRSGLSQEMILHCLQWTNTLGHWEHLLSKYSEEERAIRKMLGITSIFYALFFWCEGGFKQSPEHMATCVSNVFTSPLQEPM